MSAPWNKTLRKGGGGERGRKKKTRLLTPRGGTKVCGEGPKRSSSLRLQRKVKIINVDSIEALRADKGGKTLHFGSADPHSVINSFKEAEIKREQRESGEGERGFQSGRQAWLLRGPFLLPSSLPVLSNNHSQSPKHCTASVV